MSRVPLETPGPLVLASVRRLVSSHPPPTVLRSPCSSASTSAPAPNAQPTRPSVSPLPGMRHSRLLFHAVRCHSASAPLHRRSACRYARASARPCRLSSWARVWLWVPPPTVWSKGGTSRGREKGRRWGDEGDDRVRDALHCRIWSRVRCGDSRSRFDRLGCASVCGCADCEEEREGAPGRRHSAVCL
ncbi:hypothetical protein B0H14DRAFT_3008162, partial [Mycena olivaceomarginata]